MFRDARGHIPKDTFVTIENTSCRQAIKISHKHFDSSFYAQHCGNGVPIVVTGVEMQGSWGAADLARKFPGPVEIVDCETEKKANSTVEKFFCDFGGFKARKTIFKLKVALPISDRVAS